MAYADRVAALTVRIAQEIKALRVNGPALLTGQHETRVRKNRTWVSLLPGVGDADDGNAPTRDWRHVGPLIPAGRTVTRFHLTGYMKDGDLDNLDLYVCLRYASPGGAWVTGFDSDSQVGETILYQGPWLVGTVPGERHRHRSFPINVATLVPSYVAVYARAPAGTRKDDDLTCTWTLEVS